MSNFLETAIQERDTKKIRSALGTYLMSDPTDRKSEIRNALSKISAQNINVWEVHDGRELSNDELAWNKEYFTELQSQLKTNHSKERFEHTCKVGKFVYKEELTRPAPPTNNPNRPQHSNGSNQMGKLIVAGVVVIAVATLVYLVVKN